MRPVRATIFAKEAETERFVAACFVAVRSISRPETDEFVEISFGGLKKGIGPDRDVGREIIDRAKTEPRCAGRVGFGVPGVFVGG